MKRNSTTKKALNTRRCDSVLPVLRNVLSFIATIGVYEFHFDSIRSLAMRLTFTRGRLPAYIAREAYLFWG
jgi:hypothetical protein